MGTTEGGGPGDFQHPHEGGERPLEPTPGKGWTNRRT